MSEGFAYLDIIFFAMVAAFIALRLRSVLGRKTGNERQRPSRVETNSEQSNDNVVKLPERKPDEPIEDPAIADLADESLKQGITGVRLADRSFDLDQFLEGARSAFGMIIEAYAKGERETLQPLLADEVYASFESAISEREAAAHVMSTEIVSIGSAELAEAQMIGPRARVGIKFVSEQINVLRDAEGNVVEGDPSAIEEVIDIWVFERDTRSKDPNWELVETRTPS